VSALRIAVVGAGHMGARHAEKVVRLGEADGSVTLSGVADVAGDKARRVAARWGGRAAGAASELYGEADAVIVAVPSASHFEVVRSALEAGNDVLVEKPIAATLAQGEKLLALGRRCRRILQVGHSEWFNAAIRAVRGQIRAPRFVEAQRLGPFPERAAGMDVVLDWMIHDLAILQQLVGEEPERIEAVGLRVVSDHVDVASARIRFPGGCVANLTANRVSPSRKRSFRIFQSDGCISVDLLAQSGVVLRSAPQRNGEAPRLETEEFAVDPEDALLAQLRVFVEAVKTRVAPPLSAHEALGALRTALRVVEAMDPLDDPR
jgi:predicted dehydrogenase